MRRIWVWHILIILNNWDLSGGLYLMRYSKIFLADCLGTELWVFLSGLCTHHMRVPECKTESVSCGVVSAWLWVFSSWYLVRFCGYPQTFPQQWLLRVFRVSVWQCHWESFYDSCPVYSAVGFPNFKTTSVNY